jgi:hypothetical protein
MLVIISSPIPNLRLRTIASRTIAFAPAPPAPPSPRLIAIRKCLATASRLYSALAAPWKFAWNAYAANVPQCCRYGPPHFSSGQRWYVGAITLRCQANDASSVLEVPTVASRTDEEILEVQAYASSQTIALFHWGFAEWAGDPNGRIWIYATPSQNQFPPRKWLRFRLAYTATSIQFPPLTYHIVQSPHPLIAGQDIIVAYRTQTSDNRYSLRSTITVTVQP